MRWLVLALVTLQAATCGQKGPLVLPEEQAPGSAVAGAVHVFTAMPAREGS